MDDNFLLSNRTAEVLYHEYAKDMLIFDYHNHLIPQELAEDTKFETLFDVWFRRSLQVACDAHQW